jgi:hypothetical protein
LDDDDDYFSEDLSTSPSERATTFQIIPKDMESLFAFGIKEYKGQVDCIITDPPWNIGFNGAISKGTMSGLWLVSQSSRRSYVFKHTGRIY